MKNRETDYNDLLKRFSAEMIYRFAEKKHQGWTGWDNYDERKEDLLRRIICNALEGDWQDVANLAMMAWNIRLEPRLY